MTVGLSCCVAAVLGVSPVQVDEVGCGGIGRDLTVDLATRGRAAAFAKQRHLGLQGLQRKGSKTSIQDMLRKCSRYAKILVSRTSTTHLNHVLLLLQVAPELLLQVSLGLLFQLALLLQLRYSPKPLVLRSEWKLN